MNYKIIDLFAGAGGLSLGFSQTGRFTIVAAAENNTNARKTYKRNHKTLRLYSDVRLIDYKELKEAAGEISVVIGGPPCQGFSKANRQHSSIISMNNHLVKEYVRAICELKPKAFVMENVAMLRSNMHRFIVDQTDLQNPLVMGLNQLKENLELLPTNIDLPDALEFVQNSTNIAKFTWDAKLYKTINTLYRFRINQQKFNNTIERNRKYLLFVLTNLIATAEKAKTATAVDNIEERMVLLLLQYINGANIFFEDLIHAIEAPLFIQRMLGKMKELVDNEICVHEYLESNGAIVAVVSSYGIFDYIKGLLEASPYYYKITPILLNAIDYGAPQKRERFVIIGTAKGIRFDPQKLHAKSQKDNNQTVRDAIEDLSNIPTTTEVTAEPIHLESDIKISTLGKKLRGKLLYNHVITATKQTALERFKVLKEGQNFHDLGNELKTTYSKPERTQNTIYMRLKYDEPSGTVVNVRKSMWIHPELNRAISIREAARLQTFPDTFIFEGSKDSQYQQVGNAVPPFLAQAIAECLIDSLDSYYNDVSETKTVT